MFLHLPGSYRTFLQYAWYVLYFHIHCADLELSAEISNPKLVVIVGSLGLASNMVGLFLFHGMILFPSEYELYVIRIIPMTEHGHDHHPAPPPITISHPASINAETERTSRDPSPKGLRTSRERSESYSSMYGHPAATRASMVQAAQEIAKARSPSPNTRRKTHRSRSHSQHTNHVEEEGHFPRDESMTPTTRTPANEELPTDERMPLLESETASASSSTSVAHSGHGAHGHSHGGAGHSHGSMNMHALLLHVFGDALGNVGVIATGLIIWLTNWSGKYYFDPIISLVITVIIFSSALPLGASPRILSNPFYPTDILFVIIVRSTSFILLQGVPSTVSLEEVRAAILDVEGVLSIHELHIWQLSENKIVASVHVTASRKHDFMPVASAIRKVLHHHGIHSSTIQPEYHHVKNAPPEDHLKVTNFHFDV